MSEVEDQADEHSKGRTWISPDIFDANLRPKGWKDDPELRAGVDWLLSFVPPDDWKRRRFATLRHFVDAVSGDSADPSGKGRFFNDRDRFAWHLFLGHHQAIRPKQSRPLPNGFLVLPSDLSSRRGGHWKV